MQNKNKAKKNKKQANFDILKIFVLRYKKEKNAKKTRAKKIYKNR